MADWYRDHTLSPDAYTRSEYLDWAQDQGLCVDAAGNVDYGPSQQDEHDWRRDAEHRGEGLTCHACGLTEAEAEASSRNTTRCHRAGS